MNESYNETVARYNNQIRKYEAQGKALDKIFDMIITSCSEENQSLIEEDYNPKDMLSRLREQMKPSPQEWEREVQDRFDWLKKPNRSMSVDLWLQQWTIMFNDAKWIDLSNMRGEKSAYNFLWALEPSFPKFTDTHLNMFYHDNGNKDMMSLMGIFKKWRTDQP